MNRGSITFWLDDEAIQAWYESATPSSRADLSAILTLPSVCWSLNAYSADPAGCTGFYDSIFTLMNVPLRCPDYNMSASAQSRLMSVSKRSPG
ncbi:transposase [Klebsiella pneumoniae]|uniref:transposase n=1 Tax=Klebsiella pneumoniae TaxID=573 RepID=UPI003AF214CF